MYGLNNNTGTVYSQQNNNIQNLNKKMTNANKGSEIANGITGGLNAINGLQSANGTDRAKAIAAILTAI